MNNIISSFYSMSSRRITRADSRRSDGVAYSEFMHNIMPEFVCPLNSSLTTYTYGVKRIFNAEAGEIIQINHGSIVSRKQGGGEMVAKKYNEQPIDIDALTALRLYYPVINAVGETGAIPRFGLSWVTLGGVRYYLSGLMGVTKVHIIKGSLYSISVTYMDRDNSTITRRFCPVCAVFRYGVRLIDENRNEMDIYPKIASRDGITSIFGRVVYKMVNLGVFGDHLACRFESYERPGTFATVQDCSFKYYNIFYTYVEPRYLEHANKLQESTILTIYRHFDVYFSVSLYGDIEAVTLLDFAEKITSAANSH